MIGSYTSRTRDAHLTRQSINSNRIAQDTVDIPSPIFFTGLGFALGGIFFPAVIAGAARLTDITIGKVSGR